MNTKHFDIRTQQRGIPPGAQELLDRFGELEYDGQGHRIVYISHVSRKKMNKELGRCYVEKLGNWRNVYRVETSSGDCVITTGFRTDRIRRH
jgi:hypothetical protein